MKKLFPNQAEAIANSLYSILEEKKRASRVLERCVDNHPKWGARDRKVLYNACFDILRWKRKYAHIAAIDNAPFSPWPFIKTWCILNDYFIPDWDEMNCPPFQSKEEILCFNYPSSAVEYSYPDWLYEIGKKQLENNWEKEAKASNQQAGIALRVNRLMASPKKIAKTLQEAHQIETEFHPTAADALLLPKGRKLNKNPLFKGGYFEIQDANSQQIAPFCQVTPKMKVIDLCAGAGGKSLHLAALMRNQGSIKAFDIEENKLNELKKRSKRAKAKIIEAQQLSMLNQLDSLNQWADCVLIDAPCSGLGTLKRNPEIKWNLSLQQLNNLKQTQQELLQTAAGLVKQGGKLIYATCSILPEENRNQIDEFLAKQTDFTLEEDRNLVPSSSPFDGFYMARLVKK